MQDATFPPELAVGSRVWADVGYRNHGPIEGPMVDIEGDQGGTVTTIGRAGFGRPDQALYTVQWDSGQISTHYKRELLCIGRFMDRAAFEAAIRPTSTVSVTVGPGGGFRKAEMELEYDGQLQTVTVEDDRLWRVVLDPLITTLGVNVSTTRLPMAKRGG